MLEWEAISFSRELSNPGIKLGFLALEVNSLLAEMPGKPYIYIYNIVTDNNFIYILYIYQLICIYKDI